MRCRYPCNRRILSQPSERLFAEGQQTPARHVSGATATRRRESRDLVGRHLHTTTTSNLQPPKSFAKEVVQCTRAPSNCIDVLSTCYEVSWHKALHRSLGVNSKIRKHSFRASFGIDPAAAMHRSLSLKLNHVCSCFPYVQVSQLP